MNIDTRDLAYFFCDYLEGLMHYDRPKSEDALLEIFKTFREEHIMGDVLARWTGRKATQDEIYADLRDALEDTCIWSLLTDGNDEKIELPKLDAAVARAAKEE